MLGFRNIGKSAGKGAQDAGKELQKLKRQDLLELLLEQMREADRLRGELAASQAQNEDLVALSGRLKAKLDDKDAQIDHLKGRLDDKDAALQQLFDITRDMATANDQAGRLALLLKAEDVLADRYLHQSEVTVAEDASEMSAPSAEEAAAPVLNSDELDEVVPSSDELDEAIPPVDVPSDNAPAKHLDTLASADSVETAPEDPTPSAPVDYLFLDPTPLAPVEGVR